MPSKRTYRSLLFVPGNQPRMLTKAMGYMPDAFIPDMEDSVPAAEKSNARDIVRQHLGQLRATGVAVIPRVNARDTGLTERDLEAVVGTGIHGISIGKVNVPADVDWLDGVLSRLEREQGMVAGTLKLILWIETALGIVHCFDICNSSDRIEAVAFGGEDFTHDMAIERCDDDSNVEFARNSLCVAARAAQVQALDTPYFQFRDRDGLVANAAASKRMGFKGKFAIHPGQIEGINQVFSPSAAEIENARRIVAAFDQAERNGRGSTSLDGKVIDVPVVKRAQALLTTVE